MTTCPSCTNELELDAAFCGQCGARVRARRKTLVGAELDGRFRVDAKIAEGGFGTIYRATHLSSGHVIALKVLHSDLAADESLAARFRREGATLASLSSPYTVATYELGETDDGTLYIAMELLRGESLLDRFRACGPLPWRGVLEIMKQVCYALGEAHALGIIHRDLKPANIHLETNDHVKLIDFGIAKLMRGSDSDDGNDLTRVGQAVGTLEYMAPEQLIGSTCDGRSDIYSLGVVVYEMLTGRRPYQDATGPTSLVTAVLMQPLVAPSTLWPAGNIPAEADAFVLRCLARDPKDRFASVTDVIAAIDALLSPLARGSWSTELEDEATWVDVIPALPAAANVIAIVTPSQPRVAAVAADGTADAIAFGPTHMQVAVSPTTNPGLGPLTPSRLGSSPLTPSRAPTDLSAPNTPSRGLARGSVSPVAPVAIVSSPVLAKGSEATELPRAPSRPRAKRESDLELTELAPPVQRQSAPVVDVPRPRRVTPDRFGGVLARRREPTPPFAVAAGSRVSGRALDSEGAATPTGSVPLVDLAQPVTAPVAPLPAPTFVRLDTGADRAAAAAARAEQQQTTDRTAAVRPFSIARLALWTVGLLVAGAGVGAVIASLVG